MLRDDNFDLNCMRRALALATRGEGRVEPNPMVGCVITRAESIVAEGWHDRFGGPHAEVDALQRLTERVVDGTLYVTLEPCCHHGKTPPCTDAIVRAGIRRVVVAHRDPNPDVAGKGIDGLRAKGVEVAEGLCHDESAFILAPYLMRLLHRRPWVIGKYAMSWDGKIATRAGESRWISNEESRRVTHRLRGRMDAILVGRRTAELDDPLLTARPPGPRVATRVVLDSQAILSSDSQLVRTARDFPLLVAASETAPASELARLRSAGCETWVGAADRAARLHELLAELARRGHTNVLVEGGGELVGALLDARCLDELHAFIAPMLIGGRDAPSPIAGQGIATIREACQIDPLSCEMLDGDLYVRGRVRRTPVSLERNQD